MYVDDKQFIGLPIEERNPISFCNNISLYLDSEVERRAMDELPEQPVEESSDDDADAALSCQQLIQRFASPRRRARPKINNLKQDDELAPPQSTIQVILKIKICIYALGDYIT